MKILIAGDYVPRNRLAVMVEKGDFNSIFGEVRQIVSNTDYSIVNFESPIVENGDAPIVKSGPNLRCTAKAVDAISFAGFSCVTLANNHLRDFGDKAVVRTIMKLKEHNIDYVGAGKDLTTASKTLFKNINGETLAIINCCENEFSIASNNNGGANPLNPIRQYYAIDEAKRRADYVLVIVHGGHEMWQLPSPRMQDTYRFFVDAGADFVVNHHQHCYSGFELYKGKPIIYGLGNFCMDKKPIRVSQPWNYGYMVKLSTENKGEVTIIPYEQCGNNPTVHILPHNFFKEELEELNSIISNRSLLEKKTLEYYKESMASIDNAVDPIQNKYLAALRHRKLFPSMLTKSQRLKLQDNILCESHRDKMEFYFKYLNNLDNNIK